MCPIGVKIRSSEAPFMTVLFSMECRAPLGHRPAYIPDGFLSFFLEIAQLLSLKDVFSFHYPNVVPLHCTFKVFNWLPAVCLYFD